MQDQGGPWDLHHNRVTQESSWDHPTATAAAAAAMHRLVTAVFNNGVWAGERLDEQLLELRHTLLPHGLISGQYEYHISPKNWLHHLVPYVGDALSIVHVAAVLDRHKILSELVRIHRIDFYGARTANGLGIVALVRGRSRTNLPALVATLEVLPADVARVIRSYCV